MWELYEAICAGDLALVQQLLEAGVDPNGVIQRSTPLVTAAWEDNLEIVEALLQAGADPNLHAPADSSALYAAHSLALTKRLIEAGARVPLEFRTRLNHGCSLHAAAEKGNVERLGLLLDEADGLSCLESYDSFGWTPVGRAASSGRTEALKYLISRGADPNGCDPELASTPLSAATREGHEETARALLELGAKPERA